VTSRLLVTVVGPAGTIDLVVPAEQPVTALLDPLAQAVGSVVGQGGAAGRGVVGQGGAAGRGWFLAPVGGDPLPPEESLAACGVGDGAVLVLVAESPPTIPPPRPRACAVIGVLSAAAGMGRTTVAALVSGALAAGPGGLTVVADAHPGAGSLSELLLLRDGVDARDLLALIDHPALTREELFACLAWSGSGLAVLATRPSRGRGPPLTQNDWIRLGRGLAANGATVVLDCGPGLGDPGARAALVAADQVVLVVEPNPSPASRWMAHVLADRGLPMVAIPWPARSRPDVPAPTLAQARASVPWPAPTYASARAPALAADAFPRAPVLDPADGSLAAPALAGDAFPRALALDPAGGSLAAPAFADVTAAAREQARRVAEALAADWTGLGIRAAPIRRTS
jgi:hypothetical protein